MRNIDIDPFRRNSIGFDRLFSMMDESLRFEPEDRYPPYDIVRIGDDTYRVSLAVAGFTPDQITVVQHQNVLTVVGRPLEKDEKTEYLCRGIAGALSNAVSALPTMSRWWARPSRMGCSTSILCGVCPRR